MSKYADYYAEYRKNNKQKINAYAREYYQRNKEARKEYQRNYSKDNPGKIRAKEARHRALKLQQTPSWFCKDTVDEIYDVAVEFGYEVDHIVPLSKGGLHSHENLQLMTRSENASKGAR